MKKIFVATMITTLMVFGLSVGASSVRAQTQGTPEMKGDARKLQIGHEQLKKILETFEQNKATVGGQTPSAGTVAINLADQGEFSCCATMKEDNCPIVQQFNTIDPEREKTVEKHFQQYKDTQGWNVSI